MSEPPLPDLVRALQDLPDSSAPEFDFAVPRLLNALGPTSAALSSIASRQNTPLETAFAAFYTQLTLLWRDREFAEYRRQVTAGAARFGTLPLFASLEAQASLSAGDSRSLSLALEQARRSIQNTPQRPGLLHTLAEIIAQMGENGEGSSDDALVLEGEEAIRGSIQLASSDPYAKYQATLARLLALRGHWEEAKRHITLAIELEPVDGRHYALRIGDYQDIRTAIAFGERSHRIQIQQAAAEEQFEQMEDRFEAMRTQFIELLGLLAAVIAFAVTGVQVATKMDLTAAAGLMGAIAGGILAAFAGFSLLFVRDRGPGRAVGVMMFGCGLIGLVTAASTL